jgi:hypothetical protein
MSELGQQVEAKAKRSKKAKVEVNPDSTPVVASKVLLAVAKQLPVAELELGTEKVAVPTHNKGGLNKRALAVALYETACQVIGEPTEPTNKMAQRLASLAFVFAGGAFCHSTQDALKGEVKEEKGCTGYIAPEKAWWAKLMGDNHGKVETLLPFAASVFAYYGKTGSVNATSTEAIFAEVEANLKAKGQ